MDLLLISCLKIKLFGQAIDKMCDQALNPDEMIKEIKKRLGL